MTIIKQRTYSNLYKGLTILDKRMNLDHESKGTLINLKKGYEGEYRFDSLVGTHLHPDLLILNDLLIKHNGSTRQIDSLIISSNKVFINEIKHYSGTYKWSNDLILTLSGVEIEDPTLQLKRASQLVRKILKHINSHLTVEANIVYTHDNFYLYNDQPTCPFIYTTHVKDYLKRINQSYKGLTTHHQSVANTFMNKVIEETPYQKQLPAYHYDQLKKGLSCPHCQGIHTIQTQRQSICQECSHVSEIAQTILHTIQHFNLLFPEDKLTVSKIHNWCGETVHREAIKKVLNTSFTSIGTKRGTYYIQK